MLFDLYILRADAVRAAEHGERLLSSAIAQQSGVIRTGPMSTLALWQNAALWLLVAAKFL